MHLTAYAMLLPLSPRVIWVELSRGTGVWNECVYGYMNDYKKEIVGVGNVILTTRVTGFEELQLEMSDRDPCSSFITESA